MHFVVNAVAVLTLFACSALAHEYPLQFTAAAGARGLVVAAYQMSETAVTGPARTTPLQAAPGKVAATTRPQRITIRPAHGILPGNLLSVTPVALSAPPILYTDSTRTIYAMNGSATAGVDSALLPNHGFVDTPSPHFTWGPFTPPTGPAAQAVKLTLTSDGDLPL